MSRYNKRMEEELVARHRQERIRLPRIQRTEGRARMAKFKKSLKSQAHSGNEREQIKQVCQPNRYVIGRFKASLNRV